MDFIFVNDRQARELGVVSVGQFNNDTDFNGAVEREVSLSFKSCFLTNEEATPQTILSRISSSFRVPYSHVVAKILRSATKD